MSKDLLNSTWKKWHPQKIEKITNNIPKKLVKFKNTDNYVSSFSKKNYNSDYLNKKLVKNDDGYKNGFKKGEQEGFLSGLKKFSLKFEKEHVFILDKMKKSLSEFEKSLSLFDEQVSSKIVEIILKVSKKVLESTSCSNNSDLLKKINKIFREHMFFLNNPKLFINPDDKIFVENYFSDLFNQYNWTIHCDNDVPLGGFVILSGDTILNSTTSIRWRKLCQLKYFEENK
ncbi:MAG: flagellar assembly protein FliH [Buchnera aphidicola (Chaetogeoica yunlongensis)]